MQSFYKIFRLSYKEFKNIFGMKDIFTSNINYSNKGIHPFLQKHNNYLEKKRLDNLLERISKS
jgi:hypothetical protein